MVVMCPKCKVKLKVSDEKISPQGTRFKCPKCATILLVKKPAAATKPLDGSKVLVAHEDPSVVQKVKSILAARGYMIVVAADGIEAMVSAIRELPFLGLISVSLPKIYGAEVTGRLKKRPETKDIKVILLASTYDKDRYRREPQSLYGADGYIEEHTLDETLLERIDELKGVPRKEGPAPSAAAPVREQETGADRGTGDVRQEPLRETVRPAEKVPPKREEVMPPAGDAMVEKARRLARTILSDIYLYSRAKVDDSIKNGTFHTTFASELKEGLKLYDMRIPPDIRKMGDFFNDEVKRFIEKRKKESA